MLLGQDMICCTLTSNETLPSFFFPSRIKDPYHSLCLLLFIGEPCSSEEASPLSEGWMLPSSYTFKTHWGHLALASFFLGMKPVKATAPQALYCLGSINNLVSSPLDPTPHGISRGVCCWFHLWCWPSQRWPGAVRVILTLFAGVTFSCFCREGKSVD